MSRSPEELKSCLQGILGFAVTPFRRDLCVDANALRENAARLAEACDVVVPLANTGEIFSLSPEEQKVAGRAVVEELRGRKPVVVGLGFSVPVACQLAQEAEASGADGVLAMPPHFTDAGDEGLFHYYRAIAGATKLGVILFQTPALSFSRPLLERLSEIPNIIGLKDERGDMRHFVSQLAAVQGRLELLCGVGEILAPSYFAVGVKAFTSGIVNFMPRTSINILKYLRQGRFEAAARVVEKEVIPIFDLRRKRPGYTTVVIKEAMNLCGMNVGIVRPPLAPLMKADSGHLRSILDDLGLLKPKG